MQKRRVQRAAFEHYPKFRADAGGPPTRQPESKPGRLPRLRGRASTGSAPKARGASSRLERQTVRNAPRYAENCVGQSARVGRGTAEFTSAGRGGACRPYETRLERRAVKPIGVLARQTVRNAPRYAENCVGQSARVGRGTAGLTSAGRGGACRPY